MSNLHGFKKLEREAADIRNKLKPRKVHFA